MLWRGVVVRCVFTIIAMCSKTMAVEELAYLHDAEVAYVLELCED
jgi:hypothetical protein